ncbi:9-O-acetylesterase [Candidatus Poribacteria bacterium]|nr:MAG: 9-O-acetylesterase [Candidatus Poribacteria bacterium]
MKRILLIYFVCLLLFPIVVVYSEVTLPNLISSNMVMQRNIEVPIWGWGSPGEEISLTLNSEEGTTLHTLTTVAGDDGKWQVKFPSMEAGGPFIMRIVGNNTLELKNILVGEVWICSGQSNMQWSVNASKDNVEEIAAAKYPNIRLFYVPRRSSGLLQHNVTADWKETNPETIPNFSAVAYYFGRKLHKELNVPIGLINTSWGGTRIEPWTPPAGFAAVPALKTISEEVERVQSNYRQNLPSKIKEIEEWVDKTKIALETDATLSQLPTINHPFNNHTRPTSIYNNMIHPLVPYAIRGAIWYQGESNVREGMLYHKKMKALIHGWREVWQQGEFPFYFVQLAPFNYNRNAARRGIKPNPFVLPKLWESQTASLSIPNTGMVVTTDISNINDIHPRNKQDVGFRLALWALAMTYDKESLVYSGPLYKDFEVKADTIHIRFEHVGGGLMSSDGKPLTWFEIAGEDKQYHDAEATIEGNTIIVSSQSVTNPIAVRFGWNQVAEPNLVNKEGLPASPFRTDSW